MVSMRTTRGCRGRVWVRPARYPTYQLQWREDATATYIEGLEDGPLVPRFHSSGRNQYLALGETSGVYEPLRNYIKPGHLWNVKPAKARGRGLAVEGTHVLIDIMWYRRLSDTNQRDLCAALESSAVLRHLGKQGTLILLVKNVNLPATGDLGVHTCRGAKVEMAHWRQGGVKRGQPPQISFFPFSTIENSQRDPCTRYTCEITFFGA